MKFHKEPAGIISERPVWVLFYGDCYMVVCERWYMCIYYMITEYKSDRHLIG